MNLPEKVFDILVNNHYRGDQAVSCQQMAHQLALGIEPNLFIRCVIIGTICTGSRLLDKIKIPLLHRQPFPLVFDPAASFQHIFKHIRRGRIVPDTIIGTRIGHACKLHRQRGIPVGHTGKYNLFPACVVSFCPGTCHSPQPFYILQPLLIIQL